MSVESKVLYCCAYKSYNLGNKSWIILDAPKIKTNPKTKKKIYSLSILKQMNNNNEKMEAFFFSSSLKKGNSQIKTQTDGIKFQSDRILFFAKRKKMHNRWWRHFLHKHMVAFIEKDVAYDLVPHQPDKTCEGVVNFHTSWKHDTRHNSSSLFAQTIT